MKQELFIILQNKYFKHKEKKVQKSLKKLFSKNFFRVENKNLKFYNKICQYVNENSRFHDFGFDTLVLIFETIINKFNDNFENLFKFKIIREFFNENYTSPAFDLTQAVHIQNDELNNKKLSDFFNQLFYTKIEFSDLFIIKENFLKIICSINSLDSLKKISLKEITKFELVEYNLKLENILKDFIKIEKKYFIAFQLTIITDIFYNFDKFFKEGYFVKNDINLTEIINIIKILNKIDKEIRFFGVFDCIKDYVYRNFKFLNAKDFEDVKLFLNDLKLIEDIFNNFEMENKENFESIYLFYNDVIEKKLDTEEKKVFYKKISNN
ncbi:hypothetical protein GVAV_000787 [Gurleya vavrai]